jgi:hypothetical protein
MVEVVRASLARKWTALLIGSSLNKLRRSVTGSVKLLAAAKALSSQAAAAEAAAIAGAAAAAGARAARPMEEDDEEGML